MAAYYSGAVPKSVLILFWFVLLLLGVRTASSQNRRARLWSSACVPMGFEDNNNKKKQENSWHVTVSNSSHVKVETSAGMFHETSRLLGGVVFKGMKSDQVCILKHSLETIHIELAFVTAAISLWRWIPFWCNIVTLFLCNVLVSLDYEMKSTSL